MSQSPHDLGRAFREDLSAASAEAAMRVATLLRNASIHSANNESWSPLTDAVRRALSRIVAIEQRASIEIHFGQIHVNEHRVRPSFSEHSAYRYLVEQLTRRSIGAVRFQSVPEREELVAFAYTLAQVEEDNVAALALVRAGLHQRGVRSLTVNPLMADHQGALQARDRRTHALLLFWKGVFAVREVMEGLRAGQSVGFRRVKRVVQELVELISQNRALALSLTTLKNCGEYLANHAVNVCIYSLLLGEKLGFDKRRLGDLGVAALLRDLGKATLGAELLEKPFDLTAEEWDRFKRFPHAAVFGLLRFRGFSEGTLRQVLVAFEHQFRSAADRTLTSREFNLFTRIAQIAGDFDAMTTPRPYRPTALTPHEALRMLVRDRVRTRTDSFLLKAFMHSVGLFPVGSVVLLDSGELALVADAPFDDASLGRPRVRLIATADGSALPTQPLVELTAADDAGSFLRSVASVVDPAQHGINVPRLLLMGSHAAGR